MDRIVMRNLQGREVTWVNYDASADGPMLQRMNDAMATDTRVGGVRVTHAVDDWSAGRFCWGPLAGLWELAYEDEEVPQDRGPSWATMMFNQSMPVAEEA